MPLDKLSFDYSSANTLRLRLSGEWLLHAGIPSESGVFSQLTQHKEITQVIFDASEIRKWDSGLVSFLLSLIRECGRRGIRVERKDLPQGIDKLLVLALKANEKNIPRKAEGGNFLERVADRFLKFCSGSRLVVDFLGEVVIAFGRLICGKAYFRRDEFIGILQRCGADALGLVSLISVLVGMILAFIGAIQLKLFGAQIYIADIVGIAMVRVMGAVMTGIIMSGRTGASFAAELGLMQVNEEVDALKTLGISPVEFLVMPRVLALVIMMPLLVLYSDLMGIAGGFIISVNFLGLNPVEYWNHTQAAVKLSHVWVGLTHGVVFAVIVAVAGCLRGINCERSAEGIGTATTSAVVSAITSIVVATAIITFICQVLGV